MMMLTCRVYKKCASNGSLAVYVGTRTLAVVDNHLEPLKGVLVFDKDSLAKTVSENFRIWGQINLTFRYGREDEEVLGLRFCNEAILALKQLWPPLKDDPEEVETEEDEELTPLQVYNNILFMTWHDPKKCLVYFIVPTTSLENFMPHITFLYSLHKKLFTKHVFLSLQILI